VEKVKQIISDTIDKVIQEGFEQSRIDALLHRIELSTKHQTSNFGLGIVMVWDILYVLVILTARCHNYRGRSVGTF
jgi:Zn-dependent M16 (insulinase) family peptidase